MKIKKLIAVVAGFGFGLWVASASADVIFTLGNHPQVGEEGILLTNGDTDTLITGVSATSLVDVEFSSLTGQTLTVQGQGIKEESGDPVTSMYVVAPGYTFGDFIFNLLNGTGTATVTVVDNFNQSFDYVLGNGANFLTITTENGESIASVSITLSTGGGFTAFQNLGISGLQRCPDSCTDNQIPEPQTWALLGLGLLSLVLVRQRRMT